jgi:hypothetical protein
MLPEQELTPRDGGWIAPPWFDLDEQRRRLPRLALCVGGLTRCFKIADEVAGFALHGQRS